MSVHAFGEHVPGTGRGIVTVRHTVGATVKEMVLTFDDALTLNRQLGVAIQEAVGQQALDGLEREHAKAAASHAERGNA